MGLLKVSEEFGRWAVRVDAELAGLFPSRLHALEQAHWICDQLRRYGVEMEVQTPGLAAAD